MSKYFGIDVGGTAVKWALMDDAFSQLESGSIKTAFESADECVEALAGLIEPYAGQVAAVGVSAPGGIYENDPDGVIHRGGALQYMDGCPLGKLLRERFGLPVAVNNDGKCCALGEYAAGALRGSRLGVVIAIGTGIGGGIVIDGNVLRGVNCFAGEFSFLSCAIEDDDKMPGSFAFMNSWIGLRNYVAAEKGLSEEEAKDVDGRVIFKWIEDGDEAAQRGLNKYAFAFDSWLLNLQAVLDPEKFAIAGGISCHPELFDAFEAQLSRAAAPFDAFGGIPRPTIVKAELGNDANLYGAVQMAMRLG